MKNEFQKSMVGMIIVIIMSLSNAFNTLLQCTLFTLVSSRKKSPFNQSNIKVISIIGVIIIPDGRLKVRA